MGDKISSTKLPWRVSTMDLTDEQWDVLKLIIPAPPRRPDGRGRPWRDPRAVLDGSFIVAKKGGAGWERPSGARVRRSWPLQTVLVFLSPSTLRLLRRMKSPMLKQLSPRVLSMANLNV